MKTNVVFKAELIEKGLKKVLVDESFLSNENEYQEKMDHVNEKVNDSVKALTGNRCLFAKEKINDISGGSSVIFVNLESPNFGDYLFSAKCCNGDEVVESQRERFYMKNLKITTSSTTMYQTLVESLHQRYSKECRRVCSKI